MKKINSKKKRFVSRSYTVLLVMLVLSAAILFALLLSTGTNAKERTVDSYRTVRIEEGDCLWNLAERYAPEGMSIRAYMTVVRQANALSDNRIYAGEYLVLPIFID